MSADETNVAQDARASLNWFIGVVGLSLIMIAVLGFGAAALLGRDAIVAANQAGAAPLLRGKTMTIKIGVIAEAGTVVGASIEQAARIAADEINANGGLDGRTVEIVATITTARPRNLSAPFSAR